MLQITSEHSERGGAARETTGLLPREDPGARGGKAVPGRQQWPEAGVLLFHLNFSLQGAHLKKKSSKFPTSCVRHMWRDPAYSTVDLLSRCY